MKKLLAAGAVALMLAGCGGGANREAALQGQWKMRPEAMMAQNPNMADGKNAQQAKEIGKMLGDISLEMKSDKTFALKMMNMAMEGTYTFDNSSGSGALTMTKIGGQALPVRAPEQSKMTVQLDDNNTRLTLSNPSAASMSGAASNMVFEKAQ